MALQIGFLRMSGRLLDALRMVPPGLWRQLGAQLSVTKARCGKRNSRYRAWPPIPTARRAEKPIVHAPVSTSVDPAFEQALCLEAAGKGAFSEPGASSPVIQLLRITRSHSSIQPGRHAPWGAWCLFILRRSWLVLFGLFFLGLVIMAFKALWTTLKAVVNRSSVWIKDPDTGKRVRSERGAGEWIEVDIAELRIVPQALWDCVQDRLTLRTARSFAVPQALHCRKSVARRYQA